MSSTYTVRVWYRRVKWFTAGVPGEMENISKGPTFGDFVTIRTEASMQAVTVARLQSPNF
jgi:hypothetical protein